MGCDTNNGKDTCWFCIKGRHSECMVEIPIDVKNDGPQDCTFDMQMIKCKCTHQ